MTIVSVWLSRKTNHYGLLIQLLKNITSFITQSKNLKRWKKHLHQQKLLLKDLF